MSTHKYISPLLYAISRPPGIAPSAVHGGIYIGKGGTKCRDGVGGRQSERPCTLDAGPFYRSMKKLGTRNKLVICHGEFYDFFNGTLSGDIINCICLNGYLICGIGISAANKNTKCKHANYCQTIVSFFHYLPLIM